MSRQYQIPVSILQDLISSSEFTDYLAYEMIEPGEPFRSDYRNAMLCHLLAVINSKKNSEVKFSDFLPKFDREEAMSQRELKFRVEQWKKATNRG